METTNAKRKFRCINCGKEWLDFRSNDRNGTKKYCSVKCLSKYARMERTCKNCGKKFSICKSVLKTNATGNYCCRKCYIEKMTTGVTKNKGGFRYLKDKLFPVKFCAICGTFKNVHIHHIAAYRYSKDNAKRNLIPLCNSHHKIVEIQTEKLLPMGKETAWLIINNILRQRQQETLSFLLECKSKI